MQLQRFIRDSSQKFLTGILEFFCAPRKIKKLIQILARLLILISLICLKRGNSSYSIILTNRQTIRRLRYHKPLSDQRIPAVSAWFVFSSHNIVSIFSSLQIVFFDCIRSALWIGGFPLFIMAEPSFTRSNVRKKATRKMRPLLSVRKYVY